MLLRPRTHADLETCVALVRRTHEDDGYPRYWPADPLAFLVGAAETDAFVATDADGTVLGHVALHAATADLTLPAARRATGLPSDELVVVSRLLVSPDARRRGVGAALLGQATAAAHAQGRRPVLDVLQVDAGPVSLYERAGWRRIEPVTLAIEGRPSLLLWVYLGPAPA